MRAHVFCLFIFAFVSCKGPVRTTGRDEFRYTYSSQKHVKTNKGVVVSAHPLASRVGADILRKGGNAFDAAIATQFALAVVYPGAGNIGGGGFMVAHRSSGELFSLDFRETAPSGAGKNMYLDSNGNVIPLKSLRGPGAAGIPGTVAGLFETLKYANLKMPELIMPAITLAAKGFAITTQEASALNHLQEDFSRYNRGLTAFHKNVPWKHGDTLIQPELAATLERILDSGARGFYSGTTAKLIIKEMEASGGYITMDDLANYKAVWRKPFRFTYRDHEIITMGLPSSGGILLKQMFGMIEKFPIGTFDPLSAEAVQLMTEVERRAYADRAEYLGDDDFVEVPVEKLTNPDYLQQRMNDYRPGTAGSSLRTGPGLVLSKESEETTHLNVVDEEGNAVAVTTTLNDSYGSKTVVSGAGFLLNNEMDDFSIKPGQPNLYGAVGGDANAIEPGKRMLSSMAPTIVLKARKPFLVLGTPGGTTIPTSVFQTIVDVIDFKLSPVQSVELPKFHHQWLPDEIFVEPAFPSSTASRLQLMGYHVQPRGSIGRTELILLHDDGSKEAVADSRGDDSAEEAF